jgi:release factor glutamine methyltransferase
VDEAAATLRQAGLAAPRREAAALWSATAGAGPGAAWLDRDRPVAAILAVRYRGSVERRAAGEPLAYAAGRAGFRTLELLVDRRVLIPRPETEGLVERVLAWVRDRGEDGGENLTAADVGTGSGCIALSLAVEGRFRRIVATDRSPGALAVAWENLRRVQPRTPVELRLGDLLEPLEDASFDVIVSNPPYVSAVEYERLERSVRAFEPRAALVGGGNGLEPTRALLHKAGRCLRHGGLLALEVDCSRAAAVLGEARLAGWVDVRIEDDVFGRPRYLLATSPVPERRGSAASDVSRAGRGRRHCRTRIEVSNG